MGSLEALVLLSLLPPHSVMYGLVSSLMAPTSYLHVRQEGPGGREGNSVVLLLLLLLLNQICVTWPLEAALKVGNMNT